MRGRAALAALGVALAFMAGALPVAAIEPHEPPDTAPWVFDGVSLLQKYSEALDSVLGRDAAGVASLQEQASWANIPAELRETVNGFLSSSQSLAQLIPGIEADLESSRAMLAQFRPREAEERAAAAGEKRGQAYSQLQLMERKARATGRWWGAESAGEGSPLRQAHEEVEARLLRLRRLLDLLGEIGGSLTRQTETFQTIAGGQVLPPTAITLSVEPAAAFVGDPVEFSGSLTVVGRPLAGRKVTVLLAGSPAAEVLTASGGFYRSRMALPYQFVPEMMFQAIYYPQGDDIGLYLGSSSPVVTVKVLYYDTRLNLQVPDVAYPGRQLPLRGSFNYADAPVPEARSLWVYWDGRLAREETVGAAFTLELAVAAETSLGKHRVALYVSPQKRYAPTWASADVEVVKAAPIIDLQAPGIGLLPLTLDIRGRAYSPLGPLQDASLRITLGDWETSARSRDDGTFQARLRTGLSLSLVGTQELVVSVTPMEPWHRGGSSATRVLVINPVNIAGLALALPAFFGGRRLRRRRMAPGAVLPPPQPVPALVRGETRPPRPQVPQVEVRGDHRGILLALYRAVLRLVQGLTAVVLRPSHTLREYAQECGPSLGPLARHFQEFTLMIERLLYSRHSPGEAEAARGRELSQRLKEGVKGEGS